MKSKKNLVLVGMMGSGKSTIAKLILKSIQLDSGKIFFEEDEISNDKSKIRKIRMNCQMIHQDPYDSINPRMRIGDIVSEPLEIHKIGNKNEKSAPKVDTITVTNGITYCNAFESIV